MSEGQAETQPAIQPSVEEVAVNVARGLLQQDEGTPRDATGKFTKAAPKEAPAPAEEAPPAEEAATEEAPVEEAPEEIDWDKIKTYKRKLTVKNEAGEDEEAELSIEEMEKGVMLERAFRMKTAQLAREKESVQAKIKEAIEPRLKEYEEKLQVAEQVIWHSLGPELKTIDWNKLAAENPAEWAQKYQQVQNINAQLAHIQNERKKVSEARETELKAQFKKQAEEAVEILKTEIPQWSNDKYGQILKAGMQYYGFKADEVNAITDHRAIKVLHDAMQYQALKAKPIVDKRSTPSAPKVVKPGAGEKPDANAAKYQEGMANLRKSGRTEDAVAVAKLLLSKQK